MKRKMQCRQPKLTKAVPQLVGYFRTESPLSKEKTPSNLPVFNTLGTCVTCNDRRCLLHHIIRLGNVSVTEEVPLDALYMPPLLYCLSSQRHGNFAWQKMPQSQINSHQLQIIYLHMVQPSGPGAIYESPLKNSPSLCQQSIHCQIFPHNNCTQGDNNCEHLGVSPVTESKQTFGRNSDHTAEMTSHV